jgi:hypothetical protein
MPLPQEQSTPVVNRGAQRRIDFLRQPAPPISPIREDDPQMEEGGAHPPPPQEMPSLEDLERNRLDAEMKVADASVELVGANVEINGLNRQRADVFAELMRNLGNHLTEADMGKLAVTENGDNFMVQVARIEEYHTAAMRNFYLGKGKNLDQIYQYVTVAREMFYHAGRQLNDLDRQLNDSHERMQAANDVLRPPRRRRAQRDYNVDLDADEYNPIPIEISDDPIEISDDPIEIINVLPPAAVANLTAEEAASFIDLFMTGNPEESRQLLNSFLDSFDREADEHIQRTFANEPPASPDEPRQQSASSNDEPQYRDDDDDDDDDEKENTYPMDVTEAAEDDPPEDENAAAPLFKRGGNKVPWMNALWYQMRRLKFVRRTQIKDLDTDEWVPMDAKDLVRRLVCMTHGKLKSADPPGFYEALQRFSRYPAILAHVGDYTRRAFSKMFPRINIPKRKVYIERRKAAPARR